MKRSYLIDSSFIKAPMTLVRELNRCASVLPRLEGRGYSYDGYRARYQSRGRTRFVTPPVEFDRNSDNYAIVGAALAAGLYPKILAAEGKPGAERLVTITNNQAVSFHPSSVNFGRKPSEFGVSYLCYFTIM